MRRDTDDAHMEHTADGSPCIMNSLSYVLLLVSCRRRR